MGLEPALVDEGAMGAAAVIGKAGRIRRPKLDDCMQPGDGRVFQQHLHMQHLPPDLNAMQWIQHEGQTKQASMLRMAMWK